MPPVFPLLKVAAVLLHGVYIRYRHVLESGGQSRTINAHPLWFQNRLPCLMRASSSTALFVSVLWATIRGGRDKPYASLRVIGTGSLSMPLFPFLDELTQLPETSLPPAPSAEEFVPCGIDIDAVTRPGAPRPPSGRTVPGGSSRSVLPATRTRPTAEEALQGNEFPSRIAPIQATRTSFRTQSSSWASVRRRNAASTTESAPRCSSYAQARTTPSGRRLSGPDFWSQGSPIMTLDSVISIPMLPNRIAGIESCECHIL